MALWDRVTQFFAIELQQEPEIKLSTTVEDAIDTILHRREHPRQGAWRIPTVREALSVPAIHRAVALISSTTGMLSMQAFRNGVAMDEPPRLVVRPDPDESPGTFYESTAANLAKYGEYVWYIAAFDGDGNAAALVNVPLQELHVDANAENRRRPRYQWGKIDSTRWTPTNPTGRFVHRKYALNDPLSLRGEGPLQIAKAAVSIATESQTWAANFFGDGGFGRDVVKYAGYLDPTLKDAQGNPDPDTGLSEADRFRAQYISRDVNTPLIIDQAIESITHPTIDPETAQMMQARLHQRGDAALMFGIPGKFAEYVQSGTSLTYQNVEMAFNDLIKSCLQPLYLEPIEQSMSDLLTRSTVARFNVKGFLRADPKTRAEVYQILVPLGVMTVEQAQREEGYLPGDVEFNPVPFSPVVPTPIRAASLVADWRCSSCNLKLLELAGPGSVATCRRCKTRNEVLEPVQIIDPPHQPTINLNFPSDFVRVESPVTVHPAEVKAEIVLPSQPDMTVKVETGAEARMAAVADELAALAVTVDGLQQRKVTDALDIDARINELAAHQDRIAKAVAAPRVRRLADVKRNEAGEIVDAKLIDEPAA